MLRERRTCGLGWVDGKILEGKHKFEWQKGPIPRGNGVKKSEGRELVSQLTVKQWSVWTWDMGSLRALSVSPWRRHHILHFPVSRHRLIVL